MLIFERALFATRMSFNPSPSKSATCSWLIWLSIGKISRPVNQMVLVAVFWAGAPEARLAAKAIPAVRRSSRLIIVLKLAENASARVRWRVLIGPALQIGSRIYKESRNAGTRKSLNG